MATEPLTATTVAASTAPAPDRAPTRLVPVLVLGLAGSLSLVWGAWRVGALPDRRSRLRWMDGVPVLGSVPLPSRPVAYVLWAAGLAALSVAWLLLRRRTVRPGHGISAGVVGAIALVWVLPVLLAPPLGSRDVYSYAAHGELASQGIDPGSVAPSGLGLTSPAYQAVDPIWHHVVSAYGPANTGMAQVAVELASHRTTGSVLLLRLWCTLGVAIMGVGVVVLARARGSDPVDALVLAVAGPLTIVQLIGGPHNEALMAGFMVCGLALAAVRPSTAGWLGGAALCGVGAAVKLPALVGALYLGWVRGGREVPVRTRMLRAAASVAVAVAVIEVFALATGLGWGWVEGLSAGANVTSLLSISTTLGIAAGWAVGQGRGLAPAARAIRDLFLAAAAAIAAVLLWRTPRLGLAGLAGALAALALLGPSVHPWYLAWSLPLVAVLLAGRPAPWALGVAIVAAAGTRPQGGGLVRNLGTFGWFSVVGIVLAAGLAAWYFSGWRGQPTEPSPPPRGTPQPLRS